jgi:adenylate cyclase
MAALGLEMLKTERLRSAIVLGLSAWFCLVSLLFGFVHPLQEIVFQAIFERPLPFGRVALNVGIVAAFEGLIFWRLILAIRSGTQPTRTLFYLHAAVETSLPTAMTVALLPAIGPVAALNTPIVWFYFLFILLSTLRMDIWLSVFTGLFAGGQYAALMLIHRAEFATAGLPSFFVSPNAYMVKALLLAVTGLLAGLVGRQLRTRMAQQVANLHERNRIAGLFGQHVSPTVAAQLIAGQHERGRSHDATVLFLDIRDFTHFSESLPPDRVMAYLNDLFGHLTGVVDRHQGIINKFLGDGFMAVFGATAPHPDTPRLAVAAAHELLGTIERLVVAGTIPPTRVGIGIHHGPVMTGIVGSAERKEFTVIGDTVNLASRVEALNKEFQSRLLVTGPVHERLASGSTGEYLRDVPIRGRDRGVALFRLA